MNPSERANTQPHPDSFEESRAIEQETGQAELPNRARGEGGSEASGMVPEGGCLERSEPGAAEDLEEQAIDEGVELSFPASDPAASADPGRITRVEVELDAQGNKIEP